MRISRCDPVTKAFSGDAAMPSATSVGEFVPENQDIVVQNPVETSRPHHKGEGHRRRLREKFLESGLSGFHDYEVIELLLTLAMPRRDCKDIAKAALVRFKTLQGVLEALPVQLQEIKGIGPQNVFGIKLIQAVADRYLEKRLENKDIISHSKALFEYLYYNMRDKSRECFKVIHLDAKNQVLGVETLFEGTLSTTAVYPREVIQSALNHHAAALIFAHNHPSGVAEPSHADQVLTQSLKQALALLDIKVLDHFIIAGNSALSFAESGLL